MTVYTVESGDSVYSIARKFGVPASRIVTDNELSNPSRLTVGQSIVILYPTETYTVRGGDTLDAVSRRTGVSLNELWRNNAIFSFLIAQIKGIATSPLFL